MIRYRLILKESSLNRPLYFYHLGPKGLKKIVSLEYQYRTNKKLFAINRSKYRNRLCNGRGIYPGRDPESLTLDEVHDGICKFRKTENGCNQIYIFRYSPFRGLGPNMSSTLSGNKALYKLELNRLSPILNYVDYGYWMSWSSNKKLNRKYYENVTPEEYFSRYDDNDPLRFSTLNHISISPKNLYIPDSYFMSVPIPNTLEEVIQYENI